MKRRAIVWFRQDLRIHDNEALTTALRMADEVIPIYVFDERVFLGKTRFGFPKTGKFRAKFIIESVADLRQSIRRLGSDLLVRVGKPEYIVSELAYQLKASWGAVQSRAHLRGRAGTGCAGAQAVSFGVELLFTRGKMLYHTQDLPVPVQHTPDTFTQFRKENEHITPVRPPFPSPTSLPPLPGGLEAGEIPSIEDFGHEPFTP
jgi:Deoxyribodipyrimidine photolyase